MRLRLKSPCFDLWLVVALWPSAGDFPEHLAAGNALEDRTLEIKKLQRAINKKPEDVVLRQQLGVALESVGRFGEAVEAWSLRAKYLDTPHTLFISALPVWKLCAWVVAPYSTVRGGLVFLCAWFRIVWAWVLAVSWSSQSWLLPDLECISLAPQLCSHVAVVVHRAI